MVGATAPQSLTKRCPKCNRAYADYTLKFCLDDGTSLVTAGAQEPSPTLIMPEAARASAAVKPARVFISYKRHSTDEKIALDVYEALGAQHDVFIDQTMPIGTRWADRIDEELGRSDFLITFISAQSINSEMVRAEIEMAHDLCKEHGRPAILPVRVAYKGTFKYPLNVILKPLQWLDWNAPEDTKKIIQELLLALSGQPLKINPPEVLPAAGADRVLPQPLPQIQPLFLEMPEGTMDLESKFYVERDSDAIADRAIARSGVTITIKGPRQMGKSSLLNRIMSKARDNGKRVICLDFQLVDKPSLANADLFYRQFCSWLTNEIELEDRVQEYFDAPLGNSQCCTSYLSRYLLKQFDGPLLLAMDEVESIFETDFRTDFFSMLRSWHNHRATGPLWKRLDLALVTSTEPYQLIDNLNQSPFNVGEVIELSDFTPAQLSDLNRRHESPFTSDENQRLTDLIGGHPYLARRALYLVASGRLSVSELFAQAADERGPFGDHLRYHLFRLHGKRELVEAMRKVLRQNSCPDEHLFFRLRGAGLVRREGTKVVARCPLYQRYFQEHLNA